MSTIPYFLLLLVALTSCVSSKKYNSSISENQKLSGIIQEFQNDTTYRSQAHRHLKEQFEILQRDQNQLNQEYLTLKKSYDNYVSSALSNTEKLNIALKNQQEELKRKETLLKEREQKLMEFQKMVSRQDSISNMINQIVKNALIGFKPEELTVELKGGKIYVLMNENLLFKSGSATVEKKGRDALGLLAGALMKNDNISILVEGHTDNIPMSLSRILCTY